MGIVGNTPESGVRVDVSRLREGGPPWRYEGEAVTAHARLPLVATVSAKGDVDVELAGDPPASAGSLAERVRLLLRTAYRHAQADGQPPPRRIVRWRAEVDLAPPGRDG